MQILFSRLNEAKILIIGMGGLGAEVAKNIILGGVKSVKLMDDAAVSELDASAQFLVPRESIGQNVRKEPHIFLKLCQSQKTFIHVTTCK